MVRTLHSHKRFPLIQLPRKSEEGTIDDLSTAELVSINSTSEEVRSGFVFIPALGIRLELVSINSTSEEVRSYSNEETRIGRIWSFH